MSNPLPLEPAPSRPAAYATTLLPITNQPTVLHNNFPTLLRFPLMLAPSSLAAPAPSQPCSMIRLFK